MNTNLTEHGRAYICKMVGINDKNSIFIKNNEAFNDRMELLNTVYDIEEMIADYEKEVNESWTIEDTYINYLEGSEKLVYAELTKIIDRVWEKMHADKIDANRVEIHYNQERYLYKDGDCILNIELRHPIFDAIMLSSVSMLDMDELKVGMHEYTKRITHSSFLSKWLKLDIQKFKKEETIFRVKTLMQVTSDTLCKILQDRFLNSNEMVYCGRSKVTFYCSERKSIKAIEDILDALNQDWFKSSVVEIIKVEDLTTNSNIKKLNVLVSNSDNSKPRFIDYDNIELIECLRNYTSEPKSEYDSYVEIYGVEAKLNGQPKINWIKH